MNNITIKGTKRTLILSSKKQTNHKLIIIKGKKTRILSKESTNHKLSKEPKEPTNHILAKEPSEPGRINIKGIKQTRMYIIKGTKRTRTDHIIKGTKRTRTEINKKKNKQNI